jgi:hypothetical protein
MRQVILAPIGRAEPDDVQGWLEQGGGLGLQLAWQMPPATLRTYLSRIQRRDGLGMVNATPQTATVSVHLPNPTQRVIAAEMPTFIIEGALLWARACEQTAITIQMGRDTEMWALWREVIAELTRIGIVGRDGWTGTEIHLAPPPKTIPNHPNSVAPDALTTRLFPFVLWEHADPPVTLLHTAGRFGTPSLYEIPLGLTIREFVFNWAGGIPADGTLSLGERSLERKEWNLPLTYEQWGVELGAGVLECH